MILEREEKESSAISVSQRLITVADLFVEFV